MFYAPLGNLYVCFWMSGAWVCLQNPILLPFTHFSLRLRQSNSFLASCHPSSVNHTARFTSIHPLPCDDFLPHLDHPSSPQSTPTTTPNLFHTTCHAQTLALTSTFAAKLQTEKSNGSRSGTPEVQSISVTHSGLRSCDGIFLYFFQLTSSPFFRYLMMMTVTNHEVCDHQLQGHFTWLVMLRLSHWQAPLQRSYRLRN